MFARNRFFVWSAKAWSIFLCLTTKSSIYINVENEKQQFQGRLGEGERNKDMSHQSPCRTALMDAIWVKDILQRRSRYSLSDEGKWWTETCSHRPIGIQGFNKTNQVPYRWGRGCILLQALIDNYSNWFISYLNVSHVGCWSFESS